MNMQQIVTEGQRFAEKHIGDKGSFFSGFVRGATWANEQNAAEIARLEAERAELLEFIQNLGSPKRGSAEEAWDYFEASRLARMLAKKHGIK